MPGSEEAFADTARLILDLRGRGIADLRLLEAIEEIPRTRFAPTQWAAAAASGDPVPIACGQSMAPVVDIAMILDAARIRPDHQVLILGLGSGYSAAIAARLAGVVTAGDRFRTLVADASTALEAHAIGNVTCVLLDALSPDPLPAGVFKADRIVAFGAFPGFALPGFVASALAPDGIMVAPVARATGGILARFTRAGAGIEAEEIAGAFYAQALVPGLAREL